MPNQYNELYDYDDDITDDRSCRYCILLFSPFSRFLRARSYSWIILAVCILLALATLFATLQQYHAVQTVFSITNYYLLSLTTDTPFFALLNDQINALEQRKIAAAMMPRKWCK